MGNDEPSGNSRECMSQMETCCEKFWWLACAVSQRNGTEWSKIEQGMLRRRLPSGCVSCGQLDGYVMLGHMGESKRFM